MDDIIIGTTLTSAVVKSSSVHAVCDKLEGAQAHEHACKESAGE